MWDLSRRLKIAAVAEASIVACISFDISGEQYSSWRNADQTRYTCMEFEDVAGQKSAEHKQARMEVQCHKVK